jgi:endonuclease/exonuclease/phosphatase family metal-dependent hydrolase
MTDWTLHPQTTLTPRLTPVPPDLRHNLRQGPFTKPLHDHWFDTLPTLREIETGGPAPTRAEIPHPARILFWNVERLRHLDAIAHSLQDAAPDVMLLCEIDRGMARSGNSDRVVDLSATLAAPYAFAVEFVELDLGDVHEQASHAGEENADGLHGAAILTDVSLTHPFLIRIDRRGDWFGLERTEPRVGGTIALGAVIKVQGVAVTVVNVHLESHDNPTARATDMTRLLDQVEVMAQGGPVILGGDFNTSTADRTARLADPAAWQATLAADPMRLLRPMDHEPLFAIAAARGYDWQACNVADARTNRFPKGSTRARAKIDWFFTRGLLASNPAILPAVQPDGTPSSDHEGLLVTIQPALRR